jgi:hypothetical protein
MEMGKNTIFLYPINFLQVFLSYIFPQLKYADTVTKKDCVQWEKYHLISLLPYFCPSTPSVKVEQLLHGLRGKK